MKPNQLVHTAIMSLFYKKPEDVVFAKGLVARGIFIYASGGTAKFLAENGVAVKDIADLIHGQAILGHRVVTLSRELYAGLLARRGIPEDEAELVKIGVPYVDLVCVDPYDIKAAIADGKSREHVIENTDIGGPCMIRAGAKGNRIIVCDRSDYDRVLEWLGASEPDEGFVNEMAAKGEFVVAKYCLMSAEYRSGSRYRAFFGEKAVECKYGENAQQTPAALFSTGSDDPLAIDKFKVIEGTPPSYNNWCDIERLLQTMTHVAAAFGKNGLSTPHIALGAKHGNCCGAAVGDRPDDVLNKMIKGDPLAIFGGLVMVNFHLDATGAEAIAGNMLDGVIAPSIDPEAIDLLRRKKDRCRFIVNPGLASLSEQSLDTAPRFRYVRGGFLIQPNYTFILDLNDKRVERYGLPLSSHWQMMDLLLAWAIGSTSNSNTITLVKQGVLIGNGVGQQDRVGAAELAIKRATRSKHIIAGAVAYSDSFFPFPDGPQMLINTGVNTILTSSGSVKDSATIEVCVQKHVTLFMIPDPLGRGFYGH